MGSLLKGAMSVAAWISVGCCSEEPGKMPLVGTFQRPINVDVYASISDCASAGRLSQVSCRRYSQSAQEKDPSFAIKWPDKEACENEATRRAVCLRRSGQREPFWSARPVGFLVCLAKNAQCSADVAAPVYEVATIGLITGVGGGALSRTDRGNPFEWRVGPHIKYPLPII